MTASILDGLPGIGPVRKRALLSHFGSPDAVLAASREELAAVPGLPGKLAREHELQEKVIQRYGVTGETHGRRSLERRRCRRKSNSDPK